VITSPAISVVIPTRNRPTLVPRAVRSALDQILVNIEVIVVIDGPDPATTAALSAFQDERLRIISLPVFVGGSEARNIGARFCRGEFVALLDDDDEWSPLKLARQLEEARSSSAPLPVVTCRLIARRQNGDEIWPARAKDPAESMSEYLLCREASIRQGEGFIQTSTLLIPRVLLLLVPFKSGLPRHQDWDWLIRAAERADVEFLWVWEPLAIYHINRVQKSVSSGASVQASLEWVNGCRITEKARAYFFATQIAVRCRTPGTFVEVVRNTAKFPRALFIALGLALTPRSFVDLLRKRIVIPNA
jgi:glycosyltransferase involved in cell wall biosynthesis